MIGWVNIYAAVYDVEHQSILDLSRNYGKQLLWILSSFVLITMILLLDSKFFSTFAFGFYRSDEHTSELQSLMRISYAVFCLKKKKKHKTTTQNYLLEH